MEPRSFNRGNQGVDKIIVEPIRGFNGAAIFQSRKCPWPRTSIRRKSALQWSRDLSIAEMALLATCCHDSNCARRFERLPFRSHVMHSCG